MEDWEVPSYFFKRNKSEDTVYKVENGPKKIIAGEIKKLRKSLEVASHMVDDEKLAKLKLEATIKQEVFE